MYVTLTDFPITLTPTPHQDPEQTLHLIITDMELNSIDHDL